MKPMLRALLWQRAGVKEARCLALKENTKKEATEQCLHKTHNKEGSYRFRRRERLRRDGGQGNLTGSRTPP